MLLSSTEQSLITELSEPAAIPYFVVWIFRLEILMLSITVVPEPIRMPVTSAVCAWTGVFNTPCPLNAILISYSSQKEVTSGGKLRESHFIRSELERYNVKYLGGSDSLIPPSKVPRHIKNGNDLRNWFNSEILKGRYCKLKFLVLLDLRKKTFWNIQTC